MNVEQEDLRGGFSTPGDLRSVPLPDIPYRGLRPYRFCDRAIFFERETEVEQLVRLTTMFRGTLFYGESGAGKSSLINAGFIPKLLAAGVTPERLRVQPRRGREFVVERVADGSGFLPSLLTSAKGGDRTVFSAAEFPGWVRSLAGSKLLLIFDQFEELLTLEPEIEDFDANQTLAGQTRIFDIGGYGSQFASTRIAQSQREILGALVELLQDKHIHHVRFLFVFREDYLAKFDRLFYYCPELPDQFLRLKPPPPESVHRVVRAPFDSDRIPQGHWNREISVDVALALERKLRPPEPGLAISLSQVQVAALQLWRSDAPAEILEERGVDGLVADYLRDQLALFQYDRAIAETLLSFMITRQGTRRVITESELVDQAAADGIPGWRARPALEKLVSTAGLVRRDHNRGTTTYEIISEFLVPWIRGLKLRREAKQARDRWMLRAVLALLALAAIVGAIFLWRYNSVEAQKDRQVSELREQLRTTTERYTASLDEASRENEKSAAEIRKLTTQKKSDVDSLMSEKTALLARADEAERTLELLRKEQAGPAPPPRVTWSLMSRAFVEELLGGGASVSDGYYISASNPSPARYSYLVRVTGFRCGLLAIERPQGPFFIFPSPDKGADRLRPLVKNEIVLGPGETGAFVVFAPAVCRLSLPGLTDGLAWPIIEGGPISGGLRSIEAQRASGSR